MSDPFGQTARMLQSLLGLKGAGSRRQACGGTELRHRILATAGVKDRITALGGEALALTPAEFGAKAAEDSKRFGSLIRERKIVGD